MSNTELLQAILSRLESLEKALIRHDDRRVSVKEFAERLNISEKELYARIKDGRINTPMKDGRKNYWLNSYVNDVVAGRVTSSIKAVVLGKKKAT